MSVERNKGAAPPGSIDFEWTDLQSAREALEELPAGVGKAATLVPGYWESRRRRATAADRALTGDAISWLVTLPPSQRPKVMCERYPRLVNRIAAAWGRDSERRETLQALLRDDRGGRRQGLPADVRLEIETLLRHFG